VELHPKFFLRDFIFVFFVNKDLSEEVNELNKRISELEKMISVLIKPLQNVQNTTSNYLRVVQLLIEHGGLTPDLIVPEIKDPISKEIIRVLVDRRGQNISQITELVRNKRGTASRRIIREKINELTDKNIIEKKQKGSLLVYSLSSDVIKKWSQLLGINI
jgi:DNA-binding transcriptional ArsR family regulator